MFWPFIVYIDCLFISIQPYATTWLGFLTSCYWICILRELMVLFEWIKCSLEYFIKANI